MTGATDQTGDLGGKLMQLLIETVPKHSRIAMLGDSTMPGYARGQPAQEIAAKRLGLKLIWGDARTPEDFDATVCQILAGTGGGAGGSDDASPGSPAPEVDSGRDGAVLADECGHAFADGHSKLRVPTDSRLGTVLAHIASLGPGHRAGEELRLRTTVATLGAGQRGLYLAR